ncbi:MAG: phosphatase PAP2 family protein [Lachnospiraceae bacterium]|nr:phosphatase PAP2 family protein [Lachnospiraceae bacterium]
MEFKEIWKRLKGIIIFGICYLTTFFFMEARDVPINIIHTKFDDLIPFCEYFIIPYVIWYVYVCGTVLYLGLTDKTLKEYNRFIANMILGMIIFVITSLVYPNGQNLRPEIVVDGFFTWAVDLLYTIDTSTNILPSLHVFASVACDMALCRDSRFKKHPSWQWASHILTLLICLSTMFLKQHSVIDVIAALLCNITFYPLVYHWEYITAKFATRKKPVPTRKLQ